MTEKLKISDIKSARPRDKDYFLWDTDPKGLGIKICKGGRKSFVFAYRMGKGRQFPYRRISLGPFGEHGGWTLQQARERARQLSTEVVRGLDPIDHEKQERAILTVAQLCDEYFDNGTATKKASTLATDRGRIDRHIKPLLGKLKIDKITRGTIKRFMRDVAAGKTAIDLKTVTRGRVCWTAPLR